MKVRIWRQRTFALNLAGLFLSLSVNGLESRAFLICWAWGPRTLDERESGIPIHLVPLSKKPVGRLSGWSHDLLPVWPKFPARIFTN